MKFSNTTKCLPLLILALAACDQPTGPQGATDYPVQKAEPVSFEVGTASFLDLASDPLTLALIATLSDRTRSSVQTTFSSAVAGRLGPSMEARQIAADLIDEVDAMPHLSADETIALGVLRLMAQYSELQLGTGGPS